MKIKLKCEVKSKTCLCYDFMSGVIQNIKDEVPFTNIFNRKKHIYLKDGYFCYR